MQSQQGICERCGGIGEIVHHIVPLTEKTVNNPIMSLSADNLMLLCRDCHGIVHRENRGLRYTFDDSGNLIISPI